MRVESIDFERSFKDVRGLAQWADAVVLVGANDAGKSNVLESLELELSAREYESVQFRRGDEGFPDDSTCHVTQELEALRLPGSMDERVMHDLLVSAIPSVSEAMTLAEAWDVLIDRAAEEASKD